jgi:hypothetical protein
MGDGESDLEFYSMKIPLEEIKSEQIDSSVRRINTISDS